VYGTLEVQGLGSTTGGSMSTGKRCRFMRRILPPYLRPSPKVAEVLLVRQLRGLSKGDLRPALETLLGEDAVVLSATNIGRLTVVCGMLGGVAAVFASAAWVDAMRVRVGEGGAIRCRSQTDWTLLRLSIRFSPNYARDQRSRLPIRQHRAAIAT
jgi:hypothetical protein